MKVRLKRTWFAPSLARHPDKLRSMSGQRFQKGEQDIPEEYKDSLPHDAVIILSDGEAVRVDSPEMEVSEYSEAVQTAEAKEQAEALTRKRKQQMAKAREAKAEQRKKIKAWEEAEKEKEKVNGDG